MTRREEVAAGLRALGYAPSVTPPGERWQVWIRFRTQSVALLHERGALLLGRVPIVAEPEVVQSVIRAGTRS